jgi:hypothetical protein
MGITKFSVNNVAFLTKLKLIEAQSSFARWWYVSKYFAMN